MSDDERYPEEPEESGRPVVTGLIALVAVAVVVGLVLGGVVLLGTRFAGLGGDESAGSGRSEKESLYLPRPERTTATGPSVTLETSPGEAESDPQPSRTRTPEEEITLNAAQTAVASGEQIDLSGVYPGGEGAVLQVERFEGGAWAEFPVTIPVSGGAFSTYIFTGVTGVNRFRVVDNATGEASNEVRVRVG